MKKIFLSIIAAICVLSSCTSFNNYTQKVPKYDQKSYEMLTFTKADMGIYYDTFTNKPNETVYNDFIDRLSRMYEYEKGKKGNEEVTAQVNILKNMFIRHYQEAPYSKIMAENKKEMIFTAFDVIISTEYLKKR